MGKGEKNKIIASWNSDPMIYVALSAFRSLINRSRYGDYIANIEDEGVDQSEFSINGKLLHSPYIKTFLNKDEQERLRVVSKNNEFSDKSKHQYEHLGETIDIEYRFNNIGFRGPDVTGDEDFIAIGCSQTFGYSLPEEFTWPAQIAKLLGEPVVNLGIPGDSAGSSIMKAISYIEQFKKPKAVFAYLPVKRAEHFSVPGEFEGMMKTFAGGPFISHAGIDSFKIISKIPHKSPEVIPAADHIFNTFSMISLFDKYCKQAGIKFIWTGWENIFEDDRVRSVINNSINGSFFYNSSSDIEKKHKDLNCHMEYVSHPLFKWAADSEYKIYGKEKILSGHNGIHSNIHTAETFYEKYIQGKSIDNSLKE